MLIKPGLREIGSFSFGQASGSVSFCVNNKQRKYFNFTVIIDHNDDERIVMSCVVFDELQPPQSMGIC